MQYYLMLHISFGDLHFFLLLIFCFAVAEEERFNNYYQYRILSELVFQTLK